MPIERAASVALLALVMNGDDANYEFMRDTARHCMQSIWKIGTADKEQQKKLVNGLERRFEECITEKNCTLIRCDITQGLRNLYDEVKDEGVKEKALELIETEQDPKYRKKYASLWKDI